MQRTPQGKKRIARQRAASFQDSNILKTGMLDNPEVAGNVTNCRTPAHGKRTQIVQPTHTLRTPKAAEKRSQKIARTVRLGGLKDTFARMEARPS